MVDIVDAATRSRIMSRIRGRDTKPELLVRSLLHRRGFRFRLHVRTLPGKPDIVLPRYHAVIFVHGCFWHGHDCRFFKLPKTRTDFWSEKIARNQANDKKAEAALLADGWRIGIVWECAMRGPSEDVGAVAGQLFEWLYGEGKNIEVRK